MDLGLKGKVAIVTGGGKGIGRDTCRVLAEEGVNIVVADLDIESGEQAAKELKEQGVEAFAYKVNVTDKESVKGMVDATIEKFGGFDIIVNSAGIVSIGDVIDLPESDWDKVMLINGKGTFLCCQAVLPHFMEKKDGCIINIASQAGKTGFPHETHYSASKGAVIAFTQGLAREVAGKHIRVNAVCPGSIATSLNDIVTENTAKLLGMTLEEKKKSTIDNTPLGRKGYVEDISGVVTFLCSDQASFMTGQSINVTGGRELH